MAFGFPPKYTSQVTTLDDLTAQQFLDVCIISARNLNWNIRKVSASGFVAFTINSAGTMGERVEVNITSGTPRLKSETTGPQLLDGGKNKSNLIALISAAGELKNSLTPEDIEAKSNEIKSNVLPNVQKGPKFKNFLSVFVPTEGYFITPVLIDLNIAIYLLMVISGVNFFMPTTQNLITWGGNFRPLTLGGQWWRLLTCCFVHIGIIHLLMNMYCLLIIGTLLETHLGKARFLVAYVLTGLIASMSSIYMHELQVSAGASGAIFGMYGVFWALVLADVIDKDNRNATLRSIGLFVVYNLAYGMREGVDNSAHVGGLLSGIVIGLAFIPSLKNINSANFRYGTILFLGVLVSLAIFISAKFISNDVGIYYNKMQQFDAIEKHAIAATQYLQNKTKDEKLVIIRDTAILDWHQLINTANEIDSLKLPIALHIRNKLIMKYCKQRLMFQEFHYKYVQQQNPSDYDSMTFYNSQIKESLDDIKADNK